VLQRLTHIIQEELRSSDVLTRYGGEEFIILLPSTSGKAAINVANRIREAVEHMRVQYNEDEITITISLGVTEYTAQRNSLQAVISDADQALYKAKQNGRNQVASIL
jgi:diguanylate cyclase (GGDEF)-like protein